MFSNLPWTRDDESRGKHTGTFGEVHVWRRIKNGVKEMAVIKIPTVPQHIEKLRKERDKMLQVSHDSIVRCLSPVIFSEDFNLDKQYKNGIIWRDVLVMEFCDGGNLRKVFNQNKHGVKLPELLHICSDLGSALQYLHEKHHIIHRDIKPENVFLSKTLNQNRPFVYKIGDMGEVTEVMKSDGMTHVSTLQTHGTFAYMAPEQLLYDPYDGTMKMGESTDLWGFGTILSEAAFGIRPFFHDQGHHIHMDITSYCNCILEKSDDIIYIYKEGTMRDPNMAFTPVQGTEIPHNCSLPEFIVKQVYGILRCALLSDRRKRGNNSNGSYEIYNLIKDLSEIEICEVFHSQDMKVHYLDRNKKPEFLDLSVGMIVSEHLEINPASYCPGFYLYMTEYSGRSITVPKLPVMLENYFSEPFPSYKKGVERSLVGFFLRLKSVLEDISRSTKIVIELVKRLMNDFNVECIVPMKALVDFQDHHLYASVVKSWSEMLSSSTIVDDLTLLLDDIRKHNEYTKCWVDTFRGLTPKTEWTDVYLLVDNFKDHFTRLLEKFAKLSGGSYSFVRLLSEQKSKMVEMKSEMESLYRTAPAHDGNRASNIKLLLEENAKLYSELKLELSDL